MKMKNKQTNNISWLVLGSFLILAISVTFFISKSQKPNPTANSKINTMLMLIEFERIEGIEQWEKELDKRGLTALVKAQGNIPKEYPEVFKRLADKGYEIAGGYDGEPFWDMPYEKQYQLMKELSRSGTRQLLQYNTSLISPS